jgi:competence ComEA-like helix-hairpin-helix protein
MTFTSPDSERDKKKDGRLTVVFLMVFLSLVLIFSNSIGIFERKHNRSYKYIRLTPNQELHLLNILVDSQYYSKLPTQFYPLFFQPLPINSTNKELLMTIKGVGPVLAETIVTHRKQHGSIMNVDELSRIPGIGERRGTSLATELVFDNIE